MKADRFNEKVSAGYQSKILENAGWEDVSQMKVSCDVPPILSRIQSKCLQEPYQSSTEPVVVVGAASKGIIKRDQQNNAIVYKSYYAQNPFAHMDDDEIEKYKREVEHNQMREQGLFRYTERETPLIGFARIHANFLVFFFVQLSRRMRYLTKFDRVQSNENRRPHRSLLITPFSRIVSCSSGSNKLQPSTRSHIGPGVPSLFHCFSC
jgi:hypothetical protein